MIASFLRHIDIPDKAKADDNIVFVCLNFFLNRVREIAPASRIHLVS